MDSLGSYIATIVASLIVGYLSRYFEPHSKLLGWSPHNFVFKLQDENVILQTNSLTIQNVGRKPAEQIEIVHASRPDFFQFWPAVSYEEKTNPNGEHIVTIDSLGSKDWIFLQLLSYKTVPGLRNIRWKEGQVQWVQVAPQRVWPRWVNNLVKIIIIIGLGTIGYWLLRAAIEIAKLL